MRWSTFSELVLAAKSSFVEHGYNLAMELIVTEEDAVRIQSEQEVAVRVIDQALRPDPSAPARPGMRLFAVVHEVRVYVVGA